VRARRPSGLATDREVGVVAAVLVAGSEKAAAHRLGLGRLFFLPYLFVMAPLRALAAVVAWRGLRRAK